MERRRGWEFWCRHRSSPEAECRPARRAGHDRGRVLEEVADVAVRVVGGYVVPIRILKVGGPLVAVVGPRDVVFVQLVADVAQRGGRNREDGFVWIANVGISAGAVPVIPGVVVIQEIEVISIAVGTDGPS